MPLFKRLWVLVSLAIGALAAAITAAQTVYQGVVAPAVDVVFNGEDRREEAALRSLRTGLLLSKFSERLQEQPAAVIREGVRIPTYGRDEVLAADHLYLLENAFVEAFVDKGGSVLAFTITARTSGVDLRTKTIDVVLGETTYAELPKHFNPSLVAGACGAHINAYYEASGNSNAEGSRRTVFGTTNVGYVDRGVVLPCPALDLPVAEAPTPDPSRYVADLYQLQPNVISDIGNKRTRARVNVFALTAAGVELVPEMLSLHPQDVAQYLDD